MIETAFRLLGLQDLPWRVFLTASLTSAVAVFAQPAEPAPVNVRFFSIEESLPQITVSAGKLERVLDIEAFSPGGAVEWPAGTEKLVFSRENKGPDGVKVCQVLGKVLLPVKGGEFTVGLWLDPASRNGDALRSLVLGDGDQSFGPQDLRVLNLSTHQVALRLGNKVEMIGPRATRYLEPVLDARMRLVLEPALFHDGNWQKFDFSLLKLRPDRKATVIFVESDRVLSLRGAGGLSAEGRPMPKMVMISWYDRASLSTVATATPPSGPAR